MIVLFMLVGCIALAPEKAQAKKRVPVWAKKGVIAHASGGIGGFRYSNSVDALKRTLQRGNNCVELDFVWSKGHVLVCSHRSTDYPKGMPTWKIFMQTKYKKKYNRMTAKTALRIMAAKNAYLVVDTQEKNAAGVYREIKRLLYEIGRPGYMSHVVPQIYHKSQYKQFRRVYPFRNGIFTLYKIKPLTKKRLKSAVKFAKKRNLVITISKKRVTKKRKRILRKYGVVYAVHTINNRATWNKYRRGGASIVYTDFMI